MKNGVKWAIGIAAAVGGFLLLKNGAVASVVGGPDAPGVELGDVKYAAYKKAWDAAKAANSPTFQIDGKRVFTEQRQRGWQFHYIYTFETPSGGYVSKTKSRVQ